MNRLNIMASVIRFSPAQELRRLQQEIDRIFDGYFPQRESNSDEPSATWTPRVDLAETTDAYVIYFDLPGLNKDQIEINYHEGVLSVRGERKADTSEDKKNFVRIERHFGHFYRSFTLPKLVNAERIQATFKDGVLTVHVPKAEDSKPRKIEVL